MAAVALVVAGIRGPNPSATTAKAAEPKETNPMGDGLGGIAPADTLVIAKHRTTEFIPADAKIVMGICPKQLAQFPQVAKLFAFIDEISFEELFGLPLRELDDAVQVKVSEAGTFDRTILRAAKPHDWKKLLGTKLLPKPKAVQVGDKTYYVAGERVHFDVGECAYFPDDRTLVMATEEEMKKIVSGADKKLPTEGRGRLLGQK
jgi:hypothetical protein